MTWHPKLTWTGKYLGNTRSRRDHTQQFPDNEEDSQTDLNTNILTRQVPTPVDCHRCKGVIDRGAGQRHTTKMWTRISEIQA